MNFEVPNFPRGFFLSKSDESMPVGYKAGPILDNFGIHPWLLAASAGDKREFVIILGHCVSTQTSDPEDVAQVLLESLNQSEDLMLEKLGEYSGRYVIIFGSARRPKIVADATGMRSVFYADDFSVVASHAALVATVLDGSSAPSGMPFRYGFPGNRTPYSRTRILTPNTLLDIIGKRIRRFWPTSEPPARSVDGVAHEILESATCALRNISVGRKVNMALTAGLDSRMVLAVAKYSRVPVRAYTYGTEPSTEIDRRMAAELAVQVGISHTSIGRPSLPPGLFDSLVAANYSDHHRQYVYGLSEWFGDPDAIAMTGSLLEIGRAFFAPLKDRGFNEPTTPQSMVNLHLRRVGPAKRKKIEEYGLDVWRKTAIDAYIGFVRDTNFLATLGLVDPFDMFYWEHRMATWHGTTLLERDFYADTFIPFNTRRIFEAMLGLDRESRKKGSVFYRMIENVDPSLLDLPINPTSWPKPIAV